MPHALRRFVAFCFCVFATCVNSFVAWGADAALPRLTFELDVMPILTSAGCNSGACHGKSRGQNGFALSILAFDRDFDYTAITAEGKGRRVFPAAPDASLLLRKASGQVPHGGGKRLPVTDPSFDVLRRWVV